MTIVNDNDNLWLRLSMFISMNISVFCISVTQTNTISIFTHKECWGIFI